MIRLAHFFDLLFPPLLNFLCLRTLLLFFTGKGGTPGVAVLVLEMELLVGVLGGDMEHGHSGGFGQHETMSDLEFEDAGAAG